MEKFDKAYLENIVPKETDIVIVGGHEASEFADDLKRELKKFGLYVYMTDDEELEFVISKKDIGQKKAKEIALHNPGYNPKED